MGFSTLEKFICGFIIAGLSLFLLMIIYGGVRKEFFNDKEFINSDATKLLKENNKMLKELLQKQKLQQ
ncbi:hypothetical protein [Helicobacter cetorum]|nr:hypothetical protein [Helicobacter cetorum]